MKRSTYHALGLSDDEVETILRAHLGLNVPKEAKMHIYAGLGMVPHIQFSWDDIKPEQPVK